MPLGARWQTASAIPCSPQFSNKKLQCSRWSRIQAACGGEAISNFAPGVIDSDFDEMISGGQEQGLEWVWKAGERLEKEINDEAENRKHAELVGVDDLEQGGVHIQGRRMIKTEVYVDEDDKRRHVWHRKLHLCAEQGDYSGAEEVLAKMKDQKHRPGPKAHHALIISYVKGGNPGGALKAIREAWKKVQPLPQSYAAVVYAFLQQQDIETAVAVYAANRRAEVSSEKSWAALTTALFSTRDFERAVALLKLGTNEGLEPDKRLYEAVIKYYCRLGELQLALETLDNMKKRGWLPDKDHFSSLVTAHALAGEGEVAESLLMEMLVKCTGTSTAPTIGAINALLRLYLQEQLPTEELTHKITELRQVMVRAGISFDRKGYSLLLESSVYIQDPQIGLFALKSLRSQGRGSLQYVSDEDLGKLLLQLCSLERADGSAKKPDVAGIYEALNIISYEQRPLSGKTMLTDEEGRTFITAWMENLVVKDEGEQDLLDVDGIKLDPVTYCAVDELGNQLQVTKMNVKELRAELAKRKSPTRGNKRELVRQLQKARVEAEVQGATLDIKKDQSKRVEVEFVEQSYTNGNRVHEKVYKDQRMLEEEEEEDENATVDEVEDEEDEEGTRRSNLDDDDDFDFDYEDRVYSMMKAQGKFNDSIAASAAPGLGEAMAICRGAMKMGGVPTNADINAIFTGAKSVKDKALQHKLEEFFADKRIADRLSSNE